jgi:FtsZ-binding cell division protein ZapB
MNLAEKTLSQSPLVSEQQHIKEAQNFLEHIKSYQINEVNEIIHFLKMTTVNERNEKRDKLLSEIEHLDRNNEALKQI